MAHEIEAAQVDAAAGGGGWFRFRRKKDHAQAPGTPCANCATPLMGPWCHACGQLGEDFHRSWFRLAGESVEGVFHFDGRVWKTLPDLVLRPARLTRLYLEGHRAPQVPPLRLFLIVLLLLFFVGSLAGGEVVAVGPPKPDAGGKVSVQVSGPPQRRTGLAGALASLTPEQRERIKSQLGNVDIMTGTSYGSAISGWLRPRLAEVIDDPEAYQLILEAWSERFAFLMLPISALLLGVLFVFQRRFYLFDHLVFSMHSLSFLGLLIAAEILAARVVGDWSGWLWLAPPVHLFAHMRGVYATSVFGTLARMALLFVGSIFGFMVLMLALVLVGMAALAPG
jgi:hypothetical protein